MNCVGAFIISLGFLIFIGLITVAVVHDSNSMVYREKCLVMGGIPLTERNRYCVKPNSFMEVK